MDEHGSDCEQHAPGVCPGRALGRSDQSQQHPAFPGLLSPAAWPHPDLRHLHGGGRRQAGARVRDPGRRRHACGDTFSAGRGGATRGLRPDPGQSPALLHGLRQQQRQLHGSQHHQTAGRRAPGNPLQIQALRSGHEQSLLPLRPAAVHFVRTLRGGVPEPAGERDALHQLGGPASARVVGWRRADRRIELRFLRALRHGVPMQCADGEVDAG